MMLTSRITSGHKSPSLIAFLTKRFTYLSQEQWLGRISDKSVLVNQRDALPDQVLNPDDIVSYNLPDFQEPDADTNYAVVHEDEWIVAVNKPGNLLVHKSGRSITKNLVFLMRHASGNMAWSSIHSVSRLDRETSGIVLFAKDMATLKQLHRDFASGTVHKEYIAVVHNVPKELECTIDLALGPDTQSAITYKFRADTEKGKQASTHFKTLASAGGYSLISAKPITGRTHQIRIHCLALGCPIVGDKLYGLCEPDYLAWRKDPASNASLLEFPRQALHCAKLTFMHPALKREKVVEAEIPKDMSGLIADFGLL
jgi:23S rRNA pseudouridine955/2504/2580 synthase